jgi:O6-methylguanine-DNA--protein-cysteine methyltransferase
MNYCFDFIETPITKLFALDSSEGIHFLLKDGDKRIKNILNFYNPTKGLKLKKAKILINNLLKGKISKQKNIKIKFLDGTTLQKKVWTEITKIPYGQTISYSELAKKNKETRCSKSHCFSGW